ncbi:MAG: PAS domain S-box protein [Nitrospiraceae bacterium]|nr:MAG: PAS domain S-box protein [Nitrospiraceae bacterium]
MLDEIHHDTQRELELIGTFSREALLSKDYASIEQFLNQWAREHEEILEMKAVAPNGFVLVHYKSYSESSSSLHLKQLVTFENRKLLDLEMTKDMSPAQSSMVRFSLPLIIGSIILTIVIGIVLWYAMKRLALLPMERELSIREQAERKFRLLLESAPDAMIYIDSKGKILMINAQTELMFGYNRNELVGQDIEKLVPESLRSKHIESRNKYSLKPAARPMGSDIELFGVTKKGRVFPVDISLSPIETEDGLFILSAVRDITERIKAAEKIRRNYNFQTAISAILSISLEAIPIEEQLQRILDSILSIPGLSLESTGCIYLVDDQPDVLVMKANRGLPESIKLGCEKVPFDTCLCGGAAASGKVIFAQCTDNRHDHNKKHEDDYLHSHYCIPIMSGDTSLGVINLVVKEGHERSTDEEDLLKSIASTLAVTIEHNHADMDRQKLQEQLAQAEKMSALGRLTANVAHEIRNPLTLIGGFARKLDKSIPEGAQDKEFSGIIIAEVERLEKILRNVLTYSREAPIKSEQSDIAQILHDSLNPFMDKFTKLSIQVKESLNNLPAVYVDRDQVMEVFNNLLANAMDSMPEGGTLTISAEHTIVKEKDYLVVSFADSGEGIANDKMKMIFEPFYTTKIIGQGTGLGLPISKKIMEDHKGFIKVDSSMEKGTTFSLYFPVNGRKA